VSDIDTFLVREEQGMLPATARSKIAAAQRARWAGVQTGKKRA